MAFRMVFVFSLVALAVARAEYHGFNTAANSDAIIQEVRWPYWAETTYNAIYSQTLSGSDGGGCYFYGGMPSGPDENPPCSIIWSFWPPIGTDGPGAAVTAVTAVWTAPNMYAPPHVGEGASGKASGEWPIITTGRWYREVLRVWRPVDGTPHLGFVARWLRDSDTGVWYHLATMRVPFAATGINSLRGFQEDAVHHNRNPRRTDYRNVYYHSGGAWHMANQFTPSVRQQTERGTAALIEGDTAAFFEVSMDPDYSGNLDYDAGQTSVTLTMTNQPASPTFDPIVVSSSGASVSGDQLIVHWQLPSTSSPQFAYTIDVFDNSGYTGSPALTSHDIDPEARQKLLDISGIATPYVQLTITDVFDVDSAPIHITPSTAVLNAAGSVTGAVNGLNYKYYEKSSDFTVLPDFSTLTPVLEGAVNDPDLTIRRRRDHYAFDFTGYIEVPADGIYTFTLDSSDGSKLLIDGATVVDWDGQHSPGPMSDWVALQAGKHVVNLQYFFDNQKSDAGDLIDSLSLSWSGPDMATPAEVPVSAWYRVPSGAEPTIALTSPTDGSSVGGAEVLLSAEVVPNGASVEKVRFYIGGTYWGEDSTAPFELNSFLWAAADNAIHARVFYDTGHTLDSPQSIVTTTDMDMSPWENAAAGEHTYPQGARTISGTHTLLGDGLHLLSRQVSGDCTIIARVADIISAAAGPDGETPGKKWEAGIIMRETTTGTPGTPLGNNRSAQYAAAFATVNNDTHYQDGTMSNGGGPYWSSGLGGQRWLKLQRTGDTFVTSVSSDGLAWTQVNSVDLSGINTVLHVGMFTYAASSQNPNVHWAAFDSVSLVGNVAGPPDVTVAPPAATAYTGQSATFTALPSGNPPFSYQWQHNGADLAGETSSTLALSNLQPSDSGHYAVVLTNADGSASSTASLSVLTPSPVVEEVLSNSPLGYWRLNDAGPIAQDAFGSHDGTGQGGVVFGAAGADAPFDGFESGNLAAQFNGTDSAIAIPPPGITTANFTITGWVKRNGTQSNYAGLVFSRSGGGLGIMVVNDRLYFSWDDTPSEYYWDSRLVLPDGQWTFFALTIDPAKAVLYKATDGTLSSATKTATNNQRTLDVSIFLGTDPSSSTDRRFDGELDEIAIYNRTLSQAELQDILDASLSAVPEVSITSPDEGARFTASSDIGIAADVAANGYAIDKVQFFNGSQLIGEDTTAPFGLTWNNVAAGEYTLVAQALYDGGSVATSVPVNIRVFAPPVAASAPVPANGATGVALDAQLGWTSGMSGGTHKVYFGTSPTPPFQSNQPGATFDPGALVDYTTYYWRIDEVGGAGVTTAGPVWSFTTGGKTISMDFQEINSPNFSGGQPIGPLSINSTYWNSGSGASGSLSNLIDNLGSATGASVQWQCHNTWQNSDSSTGDDEHKLSHGYLDDRDLSVTISNIPYTAYKIYGLFATGENSSGSCGIRNFDVNGTWALGGDASTTAQAWGSIEANHSSHGEYWTEIVPGSVQGNYWTVVASGDTCTITGQNRSGSNRGCLTAVIIEKLKDTDADGIPDTTDTDDDNDGIPDNWETAHGLNSLLNDASGNADSDTFDNWFEYVCDTDPRNGDSRQTFSHEIDPATGDSTIRFGTSSNRRYTVLYSDDMSAGSWQALENTVTGTGSEMTVSDPAAGNRRFYRLRIELP
jgi:hypothetical protein